MSQLKEDFATLSNMFGGSDWERYMNLRAWLEPLYALSPEEMAPEQRLVAGLLRKMIQLSEINPNV